MHLVIPQHVGLRAFVGGVFGVRSEADEVHTGRIRSACVRRWRHAGLKLYLNIKQEDSFKPSFVIKGKYLDFSKLKNTSCHFCPLRPP